MASRAPSRPFHAGANRQTTVQLHTPAPQPTPLSTAAANVSALRRTGKWLVPAVATVLVGITVSKSLGDGTTGSARPDPYQDQNNSLMDSYGDKTTLDELEKAVAAYEARQRGG